MRQERPWTMSKCVQESQPYLKLLSIKPSKSLYTAITKEAPGHLFKALTECSYNYLYVGSVVAKKKIKKNQKILKKLSDKKQSIEQKRRLLLRNIKDRDIIYRLCSACLIALKKA